MTDEDEFVKFVTDQPAAFIPEISTLVIAELHLGLEVDLYKGGVFVPAQGPQFEKTVSSLIELTKAKTLVIVGDIKHKVPGSTLLEDREIPKFLTNISKKIKTILVKGNHDDRIEEIMPEEVKVYPSHGFRIDRYGFFHGHAWPSTRLFACDYLFMGHLHPAIEFKDAFGFRAVEQVWVKGKLDEEKVRKKFELKGTEVGELNLIVLPVFNQLLSGIAINKLAKEELIGPILANNFVDVKNSSIYMLDGTFLGTMKNIRKGNI
ncbi:MAG TPA: metallophosphoesterase [archaeon]|nr:metallophosphoesterase [archaeon]